MNITTAAPPLPVELFQPAKGYHFRQENLLLHDLLGDRVVRTVVDLGAGCGVLGLLAAWRYKATLKELTLVERQPALASCAKLNAEACFGADANVFIGDLAEFAPKEKFDLVVANPPFFAPGEGLESSCEITRFATHSHAGGVTEFCAKAASLLHPDGEFWLLFPADRLSSAVDALGAAGLALAGVTIVHAAHSQKPYRAWICASHGGAEIRRLGHAERRFSAGKR